jgi:hypothetical protein
MASYTIWNVVGDHPIVTVVCVFLICDAICDWAKAFSRGYGKGLEHAPLHAPNQASTSRDLKKSS